MKSYYALLSISFPQILKLWNFWLWVMKFQSPVYSFFLSLSSAMKCPPNSVYIYIMPPSVKSCVVNTNIAKTMLVKTTLAEGCMCKKGFMKYGDACIAHCGCEDKVTGNLHMVRAMQTNHEGWFRAEKGWHVFRQRMYHYGWHA